MSTTSTVREWMRLQVAEASGTITTNELVESARDHFSGDRTFMADFTVSMASFIIVTILVIVALAIVPGTIRNLVRYF